MNSKNVLSEKEIDTNETEQMNAAWIHKQWCIFLLHSLNIRNEVRNSRVMKSSYETKLRDTSSY